MNLGYHHSFLSIFFILWLHFLSDSWTQSKNTSKQYLEVWSVELSSLRNCQKRKQKIRTVKTFLVNLTSYYVITIWNWCQNSLLCRHLTRKWEFYMGFSWQTEFWNVKGYHANLLQSFFFSCFYQNSTDQNCMLSLMELYFISSSINP